MKDLPLGIKLLRNSLILMLVSILIPLVAISIEEPSIPVEGGIGQVSISAYSIEAAGILSLLIALASIFLIYKGWGVVCQGLDESFCLIQRIIKYGVATSIIFFVGFITITYSFLPKIMKDPLSVISSLPDWSVLLLIAILTSLSTFLSIVYGFYKMGSLLNSINLKIGSTLLLIGPLTIYASISISAAITLLAIIILITITNSLSRAEIEVEPEKVKSSPIFEEKLPREAEAPSQRKLIHPREVSKWEEIPLPKKKRGAQLIGPNGLSITLRIGIRTFGRRDFAGYISDEDLDYISRRHFEIKGTSQGYFIRDLGSLNGTWVNGRKLVRNESIKLANGTIIDIAEVVRLRFVSGEEEDLGVPSI